jgi:hypothetical protein
VTSWSPARDVCLRGSQEGAVHTKRLLRQIVTPSALTYALLGFLGGLLWLSLSTRAPALVAPPAADAPRPLTVPASGRVSLQEAIDGVRRFAGQPSLVLEGGLQPDDEQSRRADLYYLETVSPTPGEDFFKVDARTAEVVEATFRGRMAPADDAVNLTLTDAEALARRFALTHFWGFDQLKLVDRSTRTGETGPIYTFKWSQVASESGAELPVSVSLAVAGRSGQVFWYLGQRDPLQIDTRPAVDRARAVGIVRAWLLPRDDRWDLDQPTSVRLQVLYDDEDHQQLVWSVVLPAREDGPRPSIRLLVDAQNGQLIQGGS